MSLRYRKREERVSYNYYPTKQRQSKKKRTYQTKVELINSINKNRRLNLKRLYKQLTTGK